LNPLSQVLRDLRENEWSPSNGNRNAGDGGDGDGGVAAVTVPEAAAAGLLDDLLDARALSNRECYFCYYELKSNGHMKQQVFIRGSTTRDDW